MSSLHMCIIKYLSKIFLTLSKINELFQIIKLYCKLYCKLYYKLFYTLTDIQIYFK